MSNVTEVSKILELDLSDIPTRQRDRAKREVADYLVEETLRYVGNGGSPVENEPDKWLKLKKDYAKKVHGGRRLPILEVEGDLLEALKAEVLDGNKIKISIEGTEAPKADGHNQISEEAKQWAARTDRAQYKRRFIPDERQGYKQKIENKIDRILDGYRERPSEITREVGTRTLPLPELDQPEAPERIVTEIDDFFSDEIIEELLREAIRRRNGDTL